VFFLIAFRDQTIFVRCLFQEKLNAQAEQPTVLIPIRIELETDNARIRDCFTWNLHGLCVLESLGGRLMSSAETLITPVQFANIFCADLELDMGYAEQVANQILAQIEEHAIMASLDLPVNTEREELMLHEDDAGPGDCRVVLQIDVQISTKHLLDHVEWDLRSNLTPEEFTAVLCADVGLSSEAKPMIAHAIHEELLKHKKDVIEWGVLEGGGEWKSHAAGLGNAWGRKGKGPKRMKGIWRDWAEILSGEYSPRIEELSVEELERRELERERAARFVASTLCLLPTLTALLGVSVEKRANSKALEQQEGDEIGSFFLFRWHYVSRPRDVDSPDSTDALYLYNFIPIL
jgi:chromatin structure-remodeling complex subunit SFH1